MKYLGSAVGRQLSAYRARIAFALTLLVAGAMIELVEPWPLKVVIDNVLGKKPLAALARFEIEPLVLLFATSAAILVIALAGGLFEYLGKTRIAVIGQDAMFDLRCALFGGFESMTLRDHARHPVGELVHRLSADVAAVQEILAGAFSTLFVNLLLIAGLACVMIRLDVRLAAASLAASIPIYFLTRRFAADEKSAARMMKSGESALAASIPEVLGSMRVVKCFDREAHEAERFRVRAERLREAGERVAGVEHRMKPLLEIFAAVGTVLVFCVGVERVSAGTLSVGGLVVFLAYQRALQGPLQRVAGGAGVLAKGSVSLERIEKALASASESEISASRLGRAAPVALGGEVAFEDVSFSYEGRPLVLQDVSFSVKPGTMVALVGPSGAGKSTLVSLILRLHDPIRGTVRLDGKDARSLDVVGLRRQIGVVLQEPLLFRATIWENIAYGMMEAPAGFGPAWLDEKDGAARSAFMARIEAAARAAHAHEFIERLPHGYDTLIEERGEDLSGGQRQRIAIARAIIRDAPIQILDEHTQGLDAESESLVISALERLMVGRTTFVIAHRPSTIARAHKILALESGRMVVS